MQPSLGSLPKSQARGGGAEHGLTIHARMGGRSRYVARQHHCWELGAAQTGQVCSTGVTMFWGSLGRRPWGPSRVSGTGCCGPARKGQHTRDSPRGGQGLERRRAARRPPTDQRSLWDKSGPGGLRSGSWGLWPCLKPHPALHLPQPWGSAPTIPPASPLPALLWFCCMVAPRLNPGLLSHQSHPQPGPPVLGPALRQQVLSEQQSTGASADEAPPSCWVRKPMSHPPDLLQACPRELTPSRATTSPRRTLGRPLTPSSVASGAFPPPSGPPPPRPDGNIFFLPAGCCASCRKRASGGKVLFIAPHWGQAMVRAAGEGSGLVRVRP